MAVVIVVLFFVLAMVLLWRLSAMDKRIELLECCLAEIADSVEWGNRDGLTAMIAAALGRQRK